jgi:uracil-DNA glycosylase
VALIPGGLLLVDDCDPRQLNSQDYQRLLHNIVFALGLGKQSIEVQPFQWPMVTGGQADQGVDAARQTLQAYLARQLEEGAIKYLLLMGEAASQYAINQLPVDNALTAHQEHPVQLLSTLSASRMLTDPQLKRQLWQQLQPLWQAVNSS